MSLRHQKMLAGAAALAAIVGVVGCGTNSTNSANATNGTTGSSGTSNTSAGNTTSSSSSGTVQLSETGSSLLYPLFNSEWTQAYQKVAPNVQISSASTGSGTGISQAIAAAIDIGASDAYLAPAQMQQNPDMMNIPVAVSAQQIMYNLPGVKGHLKLTGAVLAKIYTGSIKYWDDKAITALNPGVTLPHQAIVPVRRSDGSGDTFLFTQFLSDTSSSWKSAVAYGTTVPWPALSSEIAAEGNSGVVDALSKTKGSIGYVGISWLDKGTQAGLGYAQLQNKNGQYVLPTTANIQAAASQGAKNVPSNESVSLIYEPGANSYPIINFEYVIVKKTQPNTQKATALKNFLNWAINPSQGNSSKYMTAVHFLPLPSNVHADSQAQVNQISG